MDAERGPEFLERFLERIEAPANLALDRLFPGVEATLAALRAGAPRLVLLSLRRSPDAFAGQVDRLGIGRRSSWWTPAGPTRTAPPPSAT